MRRPIFFALAICALLSPLSVTAHEIKFAGPLEILLHMEPQDDPIAGEPAQIFFAIKDSVEKFRAAQCECSVSVSARDDAVIAVQPLAIADKIYGNGVLTTDIIFPARDIYSVTLSGRASDESFAPFTVSYDVRIERGSGIPFSANLMWQKILSYSIYILGVLIAGAILLIGLQPKFIKRICKNIFS